VKYRVIRAIKCTVRCVVDFLGVQYSSYCFGVCRNTLLVVGAQFTHFKNSIWNKLSPKRNIRILGCEIHIVLLDRYKIFRRKLCPSVDGFGGLVVLMLASGPRVRGFKPSRSRWIFLYIKILSMPSFRGEVK
jgi:hypothetical protein